MNESINQSIKVIDLPNTFEPNRKPEMEDAPTLRQSINQSTLHPAKHQSTNKPYVPQNTHQSTNQPYVPQNTNQPTTLRPAKHQSINRSTIRPAKHQSTLRPAKHQSTNRSTLRPAKHQSINQSKNQPYVPQTTRSIFIVALSTAKRKAPPVPMQDVVRSTSPAVTKYFPHVKSQRQSPKHAKYFHFRSVSE